MKREILFRGKRADNGEWAEGWYYHNVDMGWHIMIGYNPTGADLHHFVNPETVGQFTGLTDKNGTKIFEGDILRNTDVIINMSDMNPIVNSEHENYYKVDYNDNKNYNRFCLELIKTTRKNGFGVGNKYHSFIDSLTAKCEVIGNIYDNHELL